MNRKDAEILARSSLAESLVLEFCDTPPRTLYGFNPTEEYLFTFQLYDNLSIGSSPYIAVSRESGEVRFLGRSGE